MRVVLIVLVGLSLPLTLLADGSVGIYFTGGEMTYGPWQYEQFSGYVLLNGLDCPITAAEFAVTIPSGIRLVSFTTPRVDLYIGDPENGVSIAYWPPLDASPGGRLLCTLDFVALKGCGPGGIYDGAMIVVPDPTALPVPGIYAVCYPQEAEQHLVGLTSIICPYHVSVQDKSWGGIKSLYR